MDATIRFCDTQRIAPDTHVIRQLFGEGVNPVAIHVNSMVITGSEPVIVDTGCGSSREGWLERAFGIVDPADVRWVFLSHDDPDHTGALLDVLDACPNATLVTNWFSVERISLEYALPLHRMRWVDDGESFDAGDRTLVAVRPPTFDSPTTRGLYDPTTGVYWASDSFGVPLLAEVSDVADMPPGFFDEAFLQFQSMLSPWHQWLDEARFGAHVDKVAVLDPAVVAGAHAVTLRGDQVAQAVELLRRLPTAPPAVLPGQADLEAMLAAVAAPAG